MAGFLDPFGVGDGVSVGPGGISRPSKRARSRSRNPTKKRRSRSRSRSSSRDRYKGGLGAGLSSFFGDDSNYRKHGGSRSSFFGLAEDKHRSRSNFFGLPEDKHRSRSNFFGFSKPSYYKRSSRHGFLHRSYKQLKRLLRDLAHWAKRHPWKVFFMVLMPLITGGALTALLARFGLRMPPSLERLMGVAGKAFTGDTGGLVGEAVRMAGDYSSGGSSRSRGATYGGSYNGSYENYGSGGYGYGGGYGGGSARVRVRGDGRDMGWDRSYSRGDNMLGDTISGVAKMFI